MRITIRDLLWFTMLVGAGLGWFLSAQRSVSLEARLHVTERNVEQLEAENEAIAKNNATNFAASEALITAFKQAELSEDQRTSILSLFEDELQRLGVEIQFH